MVVHGPVEDSGASCASISGGGMVLPISFIAVSCPPALPDSLPVISRSPWFNNVYFGFGHGHLGLTMAAVTGATLAAMAAGDSPPVDTAPYRIDRKI